MLVAACACSGGEPNGASHGGLPAGTVRAIPSVLPPDHVVTGVVEWERRQDPGSETVPGGAAAPDRSVWFDVGGADAPRLGLVVLDMAADSPPWSNGSQGEITNEQIGGRAVRHLRTTDSTEEQSPGDTWLVRLSERTWAMVERPEVLRAAVDDDTVHAVLAGWTIIDEDRWRAFVATHTATPSTQTPTTTAGPRPTGPSGPSAADCLRTAVPIPAALRLRPDPLPAGATVQVTAMGPACGDLTTVSVIVGNGTRLFSLRVTGTGGPPPTVVLPPQATSETVVAGSRTVTMAFLVIGGSSPAFEGRFDEAGRTVAFSSLGFTREEVVALVASLRPATDAEWRAQG